MKKTKIIANVLSIVLGVTSLTGINMTVFSANDINETSYSGGECEDGVMIVPETEDGKIVTEISLWSDDNIKALKIPATVNKVDIIQCLNLVKIEVSEDNPYLCTVDGVIYSKDMKKLVFYPSSKSGTEFIVPDTVEVIGEGAFSYAQNLKSVKLPYGVKIIKDSAFFGTKITDFELPETLTDIEQYAFSENNSLTSITLPSSLKHAERPFSDCETLTEIVILHEIGDEHFESSGPRNPDDDYYRALLSNGSNITVFVPDNSYEDYNKYYKDRWKCKNILPISKYEKNTIKGDTNCDGSVDMADAVLIMQALANPNKYGIDGTAEHHLTEQGKLNGDMNGDGLTVGDALDIQRKLLGLPSNIEVHSTADYPCAIKINGTVFWQTDEGFCEDFSNYTINKVTAYSENGTPQNDGESNFDRKCNTEFIILDEKTIVVKLQEGKVGFWIFRAKDDKTSVLPKIKLYHSVSTTDAQYTEMKVDEVVSIETNYNPAMSDWSGIGILLEFESKDCPITLSTNEGHFTTWDKEEGSGIVTNVGKTYDIGNSGYIFWTPDNLNFDEDFESDILITGESNGKSIEVGKIVINMNDKHTLSAVLK